MTELAVTLLDSSSEDRFRRFVENAHGSLVYHSLSYRDFLVDLLGCTAEYWLAVRGDEVVGVLPTMVSESDSGMVVNSLPYYGSNGSVLTSDDAVRRVLIGHWNSITAASDVSAATIVENPLDLPLDQHVDHDLTDERLAGFTRIPGDETALFDAVESSTRRNIRKAEKSGVVVAVENDEWAFLQETHEENMAAIGGNAKDPRFFELLPKHFEVDSGYRIYVARTGGKPVAALLLLYFGGVVEYFTPVTRHDARPDQPMAAILRDAFLDAAAEGHDLWNWGGTWPTQDGVFRFKRKWGADFWPYRYYVRLNDRLLLKCQPEELVTRWPGFYVVPFSELQAPEAGEQ